MGVLPKLYKLWPWVDLDLFYAKVKFGHIGLCMGKSENYLFFGTYCSFRSQSCLKHSAKWFYEVEWVSKVKVILWSWSKVTQISKLNVWLLACILRWAIQGLRALLFTSKFLVKVSLSEYISLTTHQKALIFEPWIPERVSFYAMSFGPRFMPWGGAKSQNLGHCWNLFFTNVFWKKHKQIVHQTWLNL